MTNDRLQRNSYGGQVPQNARELRVPLAPATEGGEGGDVDSGNEARDSRRRVPLRSMVIGLTRVIVEKKKRDKKKRDECALNRAFMPCCMSTHTHCVCKACIPNRPRSDAESEEEGEAVGRLESIQGPSKPALYKEAAARLAEQNDALRCRFDLDTQVRPPSPLI